MSPLKLQSRTRGIKKNSSIEWVGGTFSISDQVSSEVEPYETEMVCWMDADGNLVGVAVAKPDELLSKASESLQSAIEHPMSARAHPPTQVRVASSELAEALRAGHPLLDIVCAPTPDIDEMLMLVRKQMEKDCAIEESYFSSGIKPEAIAAFFKSAAALFRTEPWKYVPDDRSLFSVSIEQLGVKDAVISVIGQMGQSFGLILFSGLNDFELFLDAADSIMVGEDFEVPPHLALNFERGADLSPELRKEISEYPWEVAGDNAYPWLVVVEDAMITRPPTDQEVSIAEALALAMTRLMADKKALSKVWDGGERLSRTFSVITHTGKVEVTICAPFMRPPVEFDPSQDIISELAALSRDDGEIDLSCARCPRKRTHTAFFCLARGKGA